MYVYMYVYINIYIYIYVCTCMYICTFIFLYIYTSVNPSIHKPFHSLAPLRKSWVLEIWGWCGSHWWRWAEALQAHRCPASSAMWKEAQWKVECALKCSWDVDERGQGPGRTPHDVRTVRTEQGPHLHACIFFNVLIWILIFFTGDEVHHTPYMYIFKMFRLCIPIKLIVGHVSH